MELLKEFDAQPDNPPGLEEESDFDLDRMTLDARLCVRLGAVDAIRLGCVPIRQSGGEVLVAVMPHKIAEAGRELPRLIGAPVRMVAADCGAVARAISHAFEPLDGGLRATG